MYFRFLLYLVFLKQSNIKSDHHKIQNSISIEKKTKYDDEVVFENIPSKKIKLEDEFFVNVSMNYEKNYFLSEDDEFKNKEIDSKDLCNSEKHNNCKFNSSIQFSDNYSVNADTNTDQSDLLWNQNLKDVIRHCISSFDFNILFKIIEQDFLFILNNAVIHLHKNNIMLYELIRHIESNNDQEKKVFDFIHITTILINMNFLNIPIIDEHKYKYIDRNLKTIYRKKEACKSLHNKTVNKLYKIKYLLQKNNVSENELLNCTLKKIKHITDDKFKQLCLFGLQNFFLIDLIGGMTRFNSVLIFLYTYYNEFDHYDINWHETLFKTLFCQKTSFRSNFCKLMIDVFLFNNKDKFIISQIYFAMNTKSHYCTLYAYKNIRNNNLQLQFLHDIIEKLNRVKCNVFGLYFNTESMI